MKTRLALVLIWLATTTAIAGNQVVTIQIMSRPAASLVEAVRPVLGQGASVSAFHDKLIVTGNPSQIAAARAVVAEIDRPARRLIIEVREANELVESNRSLGYGVDSGNARLGRVAPGSRGQLSYHSAQTRGRGDSRQTIQALDGRPAMIRAGQSVPIYQTHQQIVGNTVVQGFNMHYRDTGSGFMALPRVHGDQVTVEIHQRNDRPSGNGRFDTQGASTVLRGRLGQWLTLGSTGGQQGREGDRLGRHITTQRERDSHLQLRVLTVD